MAKIVVVIEDVDGKGVKVTCTPSVEECLKSIYNTLAGGTMAEGYAVAVLNGLRDLDKRMSDKNNPGTIKIPKLVL